MLPGHVVRVSNACPYFEGSRLIMHQGGSRRSLCVFCACLQDARRDLVRRRTKTDQRYVHASRSLAESSGAAAAAVQEDYPEEVPPVGSNPSLTERSGWTRPELVSVGLTEDEQRQKQVLKERALDEESPRTRSPSDFKVRYYFRGTIRKGVWIPMIDQQGAPCYMQSAPLRTEQHGPIRDGRYAEEPRPSDSSTGPAKLSGWSHSQSVSAGWKEDEQRQKWVSRQRMLAEDIMPAGYDLSTSRHTDKNPRFLIRYHINGPVIRKERLARTIDQPSGLMDDKRLRPVFRVRPNLGPQDVAHPIEQTQTEHTGRPFIEDNKANQIETSISNLHSRQSWNVLEPLGEEYPQAHRVEVMFEDTPRQAEEEHLQVRRVYNTKDKAIVQPGQDAAQERLQDSKGEMNIRPTKHGTQEEQSEDKRFRMTQASPGPELFRRVRLNEADDCTDQATILSTKRSIATRVSYRPFAFKSQIQKQVKPSPPEIEEQPSRKERKGLKDSDEGEEILVERRSKGHKNGRRRQQKYDEDEYDIEMDISDRREERRRQRKLEKAARKAAAAPPTPVVIPEFISVTSLAYTLKVRIEDFMKKLEKLGFEIMNHDYILDAETAGLIATEYNYEPILEKEKHTENDLYALPESNDKSKDPTRPPVITIMGHVDHGKTTLLDYMRKSSVAASEHGGITQHIGAFSVSLPAGKVITFLDTPGHEAFLNMRQRGANVTDIVVLVVAADDSVKPQTIEAIRHAKAANAPMIVAINKIDKAEANVERVKQDLVRHGVEVEDFGGDTQVVCVSGKTGQGMEELEEAIVTLSEILDVRADPAGPQCEGWILETTTKKAGRVATILVKRGTFRTGQVIVAGSTWARIRTLKNEAGNKIESAGPGMPVEVDGWKDQPNAGDEVIQAPNETKAKSAVAFRIERAEKLRTAADVEALNELRQEKTEENNRASETDHDNDKPIEVLFVLKADVHGSVEAIASTLEHVGNSKVRARILRSGVGPVTEFDVDHAAAAEGHILAFNIPVEPSILRLADAQGVQILEHTIIYHLTDDVRNKLSEKLPPIVTQHVTGEAEIGQIFSITVKAADGGKKERNIAGCKVRNGIVNRNSKVRVVRNGETIYDGTSFPGSTTPHPSNPFHN